MKRKITAFLFCLTLTLSGSTALASAAVSEGPAALAPVSQEEMLAASSVQDQRDAIAPYISLQEEAAPQDLEATVITDEDSGAAYSRSFDDGALENSCGDGPVGLDLQSSLEPFWDSEIKACWTGAYALAEEEALESTSIPGVPIVVNKNVESFIRYFQTGGRKHFERWWDRSQNYMTMLKSILRENGLPEDLSYIAFIESGINPTARSRANAVGMWQFIRGTALMYGLRVDWWIDERMDPEKATYAAAKYFKNLYDQFGSWYLAAAGYNAGEGKVMRAVKKHNSDDFWVLANKRKPFRRETKDYVPKYLAALLISKDPTNYGFEKIEYADGLPYEKVKISQATDLRVIAEAAGTTVEEIKRLNPELLRWFTPPNYPGYEVKIPSGTSQQFVENMSNIPPAKRIAFLKHKVRKGETVSKIAKRYGTSVSPIMYLNNLKSAKYIRPGTILMVPVRADNIAGRKGGYIAEVHTHMELQS